MATFTNTLSSLIVPEVFNPYVQQLTQEKSRLINSSVIARDPLLDSFLAGGGMTTNIPSFKDLSSADAESVSDGTTDTLTAPTTGQKAGLETQIRLSRNKSWRSFDLERDLAGADPMASIANRVSDYWSRRLQAAFIATMKGVFANNTLASPGGGAAQYDLTRDIAWSNGATQTVANAYSIGTSTFSASAFIDAAMTMGDSLENLTTIFVHSVVYARMLKNNLIEFVANTPVGTGLAGGLLDSQATTRIPTFMGREVIVDDSMPVVQATSAAGVPIAGSYIYESWLFARGAVRLGLGAPKIPTETIRLPGLGNGGGAEELYNRVEWCIAPVGTSYVGATTAGGGPANGNAATANTLAHAASWQRAYAERKQIPFARLLTRES